MFCMCINHPEILSNAYKSVKLPYYSREMGVGGGGGGVCGAVVVEVLVAAEVEMMVLKVVVVVEAEAEVAAARELSDQGARRVEVESKNGLSQTRI